LFRDLIGASYNDFTCYELAREIYKRLGIELPEFVNLTGVSLIRQLVIEKQKRTIELSKPEPFCIVHIARGEAETHVGVVLGDCKQFIHSCSRTGVIISKLKNYKDFIRGYYKWKQE